MPNLRDIRNRIRSVKNTQQLTYAMKLVSATKLSQFVRNKRYKLYADGRFYDVQKDVLEKTPITGATTLICEPA